MDVALETYISNKQRFIQNEISNYFSELIIPDQLKKSMLYSLEAGGKNLRPILLMASYEAYDDDLTRVISAAAALEMIHTYSLIHDDLPAMDDDTYRRGKLTNHMVFDEATAILAGDALLTYSFEIIANDPLINNNQKVQLLKMLSQSSGPKGMVAGQILDMRAENRAVTLQELEHIHTLKTGELLKFAVTAGAYLGNASSNQIANLEEFSHYLGLIFQVQDDILDVTGDEEKLGKSIGSDEQNNKSTYPKLLGIDGAIQMRDNYIDKAKEALKKADADTSYLMALTEYFGHRDH